MNLTRIAEALSNARQDLLDHSHEGPPDVRRIIERNFKSLTALVAEEAAHEPSARMFDQAAVEDKAFNEARQVVEREYFSIMRQVARRLRKWMGSDPLGDVKWAVEKLTRCSTPGSGETTVTGLELVSGHHRFKALKEMFGGKGPEFRVDIHFVPQEGEEMIGLRRMVRILGERRDRWRKRFEDLQSRVITVSHRVMRPKGMKWIDQTEFDRRGQMVADLTRELAETQEQLKGCQTLLLQTEGQLPPVEAKAISELRAFVTEHRVAMGFIADQSYLQFLNEWLRRHFKPGEGPFARAMRDYFDRVNAQLGCPLNADQAVDMIRRMQNHLQRLKNDLADYRKALGIPNQGRVGTLEKIEQLLAALRLAQQVGRWYKWNDGKIYSDRRCLEAMTIDAVEAALK